MGCIGEGGRGLEEKVHKVIHSKLDAARRCFRWGKHELTQNHRNKLKVLLQRFKGGKTCCMAAKTEYIYDPACDIWMQYNSNNRYRVIF